MLFDWARRLLHSVAGATFASALVAWVETREVILSVPHPPSFKIVFFAMLGVLAPLAWAVGLAVGAFSIFVEPVRPHAPQEYLAALRCSSMLARARNAALVPLAVAFAFLWSLAAAHVARHLLADGAPRVVGAELGVISLVLLGLAAAGVLACVLPLRRILASFAPASPRFVDPVTTGVVALAIVLFAGGCGVVQGDVGGNGPGPLAILGVLKRPELDLRPVFNLATIALSAFLAPVAFYTLRLFWMPVALAVALVPLHFTRKAAEGLNEDPHTAHLIEHAPLAKSSLALLRRLTDRDKDGYSPFFGGGDCDDADPARYPTAVDVPGNGVDEDCSGEDTPLPAVVPVVVRPKSKEGLARLDPKMNLVLITVDTLKIDLGFMGYDKPVSPNLDALAAKSAVFDRMYSMASYTGKSIGPFLIGKYPSECDRDGGHFNTYYPSNVLVTERLKDAGFFTMGAASHWYFVPWSGLTQGMDDWDTSAIPKSGQGDVDTSVTSQELADVAIRMLTDPKRTDGRFFMWVHFFDPHEQYMPHPEAPPEIAAGAGTPSQKAKAAYDAEVWFTDHHIGRVLDTIEGQPWADRTAIIVTSDHGETFGEHGMSFHGGELWEQLVRVPFIVYFPGVFPHHVPVKRSHIDLVPTILDLLQVKATDDALSGQSMLNDVLAGPKDSYEERDVYIDMPVGPYTGMRHALITGPSPGMKLYNMGPHEYALFDLAKDPGELEDLAQSEPDELKDLTLRFTELRGRLHEINVPPSASSP